MKKLITTMIIGLSLTVSANAANSENYATTFVKENHAVELLKEKIKSSKEIAQKQKMMKEKYFVDTTYKGSTKEEIDASLVAQAKRVRDESVSYMNKTYGNIDCSKVKPFEAYNKALCKAMNENVVDAIEDLKKLDKLDNRAFCVRQMVNLQLADKDNDVISRVTKNIVLSKLYKKPLTGTCTKVFNIVSKK
jgi:hypothetical protein